LFHNQINPLDRILTILCLNRALWGEVSPELRAAMIIWENKPFHLYFFYDGKISKEDYQSAKRAALEVISSYPKHKIDFDILRWDYPKPIPKEGELIYLRREC